ncbi:probable E3 ubiquitin-protein ligase LUL4 [Morus notabilis]|uniref:probable E3 ubiquitin-protein ligase LUL4 n=1 Tax=Morus notabilis TaxID=981085 RepID=UPI000CED4160|nr:probable E3 ubiquitin-protein ligase LUL4 [Morus notabilis]
MGLSFSRTRRNQTGRRTRQRRRQQQHRHNQPPSSSSASASSSSSSSSANPARGPLPSGSFAPAKKIQNDVNVHKDSIRITRDDDDSDSLLVSFTFDALVDGSITIFYFAKEGVNCTFTPVYPEYYTPTKIPFQKGLDQKFFQPSGTGIDLGFFEMNELSNSTTAEGIFPLVIQVEAFPHPSTDVESGQPHSITSPHTQITQAVLDETKDSQYQVRVIKQILWIDEVRYELCELYGIGNSDKSGFDDSEPGKECVICMMEPKNTAVLPCRHMCMCSDCAKALRARSNKCPICRQLIQELIVINVDKAST